MRCYAPVGHYGGWAMKMFASLTSKLQKSFIAVIDEREIRIDRNARVFLQ